MKAHARRYVVEVLDFKIKSYGEDTESNYEYIKTHAFFRSRIMRNLSWQDVEYLDMNGTPQDRLLDAASNDCSDCQYQR